MFISLNSYLLMRCTLLSVTSLLLMLSYRMLSILTLDHFEFDNPIATQGLKSLRSKRTRQTGGGSYPLVRRMMSPGWMRLPSSSHTEMAMLPLLSATLHERTSCPSFVFVTRPARAQQSSVKSQP